MMPSDVLTAQAEYSVCPTKNRLSKTFTGSACHSDRGGGPCCAPLAPRCAGAGAGAGSAAGHNLCNSPVWSLPAAALAAATCESAPCGLACPKPYSARMTQRSPVKHATRIVFGVITPPVVVELALAARMVIFFEIMIQPDALTKNDALLWSPGTGVDLWTMFCAARAGDIATLKTLLAKDPS